MTTISAQTILRSRHAKRPDKILSTLLLRYPRWIHSEFMTHRAFSRNAASSRAIPIQKLINDVMDNPAVPLFWGKNQPGMQAQEECTSPVKLHLPGSHEPFDTSNEEAWLVARTHAVEMAQAFADAGYHKQIVNRLLEPFAHITVLVSATEWDNFLELRDHEDAEPHIRMLAQEIGKELERDDNIQTLHPGEWHLPFIRQVDWSLFAPKDGGTSVKQNLDLIKISVARCASTSYKTVDGFDMSHERAQAIFDKLVTSKPIHASPLEHVAQADQFFFPFRTWKYPSHHRNFKGFRQYRAMIGA